MIYFTYIYQPISILQIYNSQIQETIGHATTIPIWRRIKTSQESRV